MNMVKEGIQTRRRKQKSAATNPIPKVKQSKTTMKSTNIETHAKPDNYLSRSATYPYGDLYSSHIHLIPHTYDPSVRFPSQQQIEMTSNNFDAELCAREIVSTTRDNQREEEDDDDEQQHLHVIKTVNSN